MNYVAVEVKKKQGETTRSLLRRFTRRVQQSRILISARKGRFQEKEKSRREKREEALRKRKVSQEKEKLRKMGLLEEEPKWKKR